MSEAHPAPAGDHGITQQPGGVPVLFPTEEWLQFQRSDMGAGKVVVALMAAIFVVGLLLYTTITLICVS